MKTFHRLLLMVLVIVLIAIPSASFAAQSAVNLGASSTYAVLAGTTITNIGTTVINGSGGRDVGAYPGIDSTKIGNETVNAPVSLPNTDTMEAQRDLVAAYNDAAGRSPVTRISTELGGKTLTPGVYDSASGTFELTGTLTLDAQGDPDGVFIFLTESTLITASNSMVDTIGSASYDRIFWKVGSTATLGADSGFAGYILAFASIEAQNGAFILGQLLSRNGEVILNNNRITTTLTPTVDTSTFARTKTTTPRYAILIPGMAVVIAGVVIWSLRGRFEYRRKNVVR